MSVVALEPRAEKSEKVGFFGQAVRHLRASWQFIAGSEYDLSTANLKPDLPVEDLDRVRRQMRDCLEGRSGEVSARARAAALGRAYLALDARGRARFLRVLAEEFDVDDGEIDRAVDALREAEGVNDRRVARRQLRRALEAPRVRLLTQFNSLPEGVKVLVDMRGELIPLARQDTQLALLDDDLKGLLASWFDVDFLELRRITWDTASGALLERLMAYEAVHPIESWTDLKDRLDFDRRYFAFFHPRMRDEPLIFIEVALVNGIADNVQKLLDPAAPVIDPATADTAIFYSISNAQRGLDGISFGNFLIKRVVDRLRSEFPNLKTFATLSPIPGYTRWLSQAFAKGHPGLLSPSERRTITAATGRSHGTKGWLKSVVTNADWVADEATVKAIRPVLMRLCAQYLAKEARGEGIALDPVAHFHLSNGARIERLNWMADRSSRGLERSAGMMVNYVYDLAKIDGNHEAYRARGQRALSSAISSLLKE